VNSETTQNGTQLSVARNHESKEQVPRNLTLKEQLPEDKGRADVETQKLVAELAQVLEKNSPDTKQAAQSTEQTPDTKPEINVRVDKPTPTLQIAVPEKTEPLKLASKTAVAEATKTESTVATSGDAAVGSVAHLNNAASVQQLITDWQDAWRKQDWPRYINAYIDERPHGVKMSLEEWRAFRKQRLLSPPWIKLEFGDVRLTRLNSHWFRAEFYQRFEKPNYADETTKRLELMLTASGWKIASENPIGTVVLKRSAN
jgi:hypothetical protein